MTAFTIRESGQIVFESYSAEARRCVQRIIAAGTSLRGTVYTEDVLKSAVPLFEGVQTFADHPSADEDRARPERSVRNITGWLTEVRYQEGALWATRHFTRNQAGQDMLALVEDIQAGRAPITLIGASINAIGKGKRSDGKVFIEAIDRVISVDDVTVPAAGGGFLKESAATELAALLTYEEWFGNTAFIERARKEWQTLKRDNQLTEATALAESVGSELAKARTQIAELQRDLLAEQENLSRLRARIDINEALRAINLPDDWKRLISLMLESLPRTEWDAAIRSEVDKARSLIRASRGSVPAKLQVQEDAPPTKVVAAPSREQRIRAARTPEELKVIERETQ